MEQRFFQWLSGERRGEVVVYDDIIEDDGEVFIVFKDDSRINDKFVAALNETDATGKLMAEVENMSKLWQFKEEVIGNTGPIYEQDWESQQKFEVPSADDLAHADLTGETGTVKARPKKKKVTLIPPTKTRPEVVESKFGMVKQAPAPVPAPAAPVSKWSETVLDTSDPVYIMLDKAKKVDSEVNMTLTISLPSKSLFDVAKESFEEGDKRSLEYIIENLDVSEIKEALKRGIEEMYGVESDERIMEMPAVSPDMTNIVPISYEPEVIEEPEVREATDEEIEEIKSKMIQE